MAIYNNKKVESSKKKDPTKKSDMAHVANADINFCGLSIDLLIDLYSDNVQGTMVPADFNKLFVLGIVDDPQTSVDWKTNSRDFNNDAYSTSLNNTSEPIPLSMSPWLADFDTSVHVIMDKTDFQHL